MSLLSHLCIINGLINGTHLNRHLVWVNLESDLLPGDLSESVVGDDRPGSGVVHFGRTDPERSVQQFGNPIGIFHFLIFKLPPSRTIKAKRYF